MWKPASVVERSWSRGVAKLLTVSAGDAFHGFSRCGRRRCGKMESDEETGEVCHFRFPFCMRGTGVRRGLIAMAKGIP